MVYPSHISLYRKLNPTNQVDTRKQNDKMAPANCTILASKQYDI